MTAVTSTRPAEEQDWHACWPLLQGMGVMDGEDAVKARFLRTVRDPSWLVLLGEVEGTAVGYAAAQDYGDHLRAGRRGRLARLHDLYVVPAARGAGVGTALMSAVVSWAEPRVGYLQWQAHHVDAAPFYERLGYRGESCPQPDYPEFEVAFV